MDNIIVFYTMYTYVDLCIYVTCGNLVSEREREREIEIKKEKEKKKEKERFSFGEEAAVAIIEGWKRG